MQTSSRFIRLFQNMGFILALAFIIGLAIPQGAAQTISTVTPLLAMIMTLSIVSASPRITLNLKKVWKPVLISLLSNYIVLTFTIIGLSYLLLQDQELITGFVILAAVPPAVAVIPFAARLDGDLDFSLIGTIALYLFALLLVPIITIFFLGINVIDPETLLITLAQLIAVPFGIAVILRRTKISAKIEKYRGTIINWGFFVVVYTIIGANQAAFLTEPFLLPRIIIISFISTFVLGTLINNAAKALHIEKTRRISLILLGTRKNYGMAAAIALALFSSKAAIPAAITTALAIVHFVWLNFWVKRMN